MLGMLKLTEKEENIILEGRTRSA